MSDIVMQVQSQLENERNIIALSFELLKVVNSGLPQNFQGNTQEMVMMYISMRAERMNQFSQISDELIHQMGIFRSFNSAMKDQFEQANQLSHDGQSEQQQTIEKKDSDLKEKNINSEQAMNLDDQNNVPSSAPLCHENCQQQTIVELQQQQQLQMQLIEKLQQQQKSQYEQILLLSQQQSHQQHLQLLSQQFFQQQQQQPEIVQQYKQNQTKNDRNDQSLLNQSGKPKSMFSAILMKQTLDQQNITEEQENNQEIAKDSMDQQATHLKSTEELGQLGKKERMKNNKKLEETHDKCGIDEEKEEEQDEFDEEYSNETDEYSGQETNSQNGASSRSQNQNSSRLINSNQSSKKRSSSSQNKKIKNCRQYLKDLPVDVQNIIKQAKRSEVATLAKKYNINYSVVKYAALKLEEENQPK